MNLTRQKPEEGRGLCVLFPLYRLQHSRCGEHTNQRSPGSVGQEGIVGEGVRTCKFELSSSLADYILPHSRTAASLAGG